MLVFFVLFIPRTACKMAYLIFINFFHPLELLPKRFAIVYLSMKESRKNEEEEEDIFDFEIYIFLIKSTINKSILEFFQVCFVGFCLAYSIIFIVVLPVVVVFFYWVVQHMYSFHVYLFMQRIGRYKRNFRCQISRYVFIEGRRDMVITSRLNNPE